MPLPQPAIFPGAWRPVPGAPLVRVGPDEDGGYVIGAEALARARRLISGGLFDDWRFEADFQKRTGAELDCYDPTVMLKFWAKRYYAYLKGIARGTASPRAPLRYFEFRRFFDGDSARHRRAFISYPNWATDLRTAIGASAGADTFLKIDIEGSEYRVLGDLIARQDAICGFVIEFHDIDLHVERISRFIADAAPWFRVEHLHVNNYANRNARWLSRHDRDEPRPGRCGGVRRGREHRTAVSAPRPGLSQQSACRGRPLHVCMSVRRGNRAENGCR